MPTLSDILNARIGKGGKSKTSVAAHLGVSERTIENYMKGSRQPKPDAMVELAKFLGFNLSELSEQTVPREMKMNGHAESLETIVAPKTEISDKYIRLLEDSLKEKKDQLKELQTRLNDLEGRQRDFLAKVEDSIERYEHLVLAQLQNHASVQDQVKQGNSPTVLQQVYKKGDKAQKKGS